MAITTYSELQTAIANWLMRSDLTSVIPDFIALGESRINRDLRIRLMETPSSVTISAQTAALPTNFLGAKRFYIDASPDTLLTYNAPDVFWGINASQVSGRPVTYTIEAGNFVFGPSPDATYTGKLLWYQKITAVSSTVTGNTLFSDHPDIYLYSALTEAWGYLLEDSEQQRCDQHYLNIKQAIQENDIKGRHTGSPLITRPNRTIY